MAEFNWIDPDIYADHEKHGDLAVLEENRVLEADFHDFFAHRWSQANFAELFDRWDPIVTSEVHNTRVLAKTALWNVIQLRERRHQSKGDVVTGVA